MPVHYESLSIFTAIFHILTSYESASGIEVILDCLFFLAFTPLLLAMILLCLLSTHYRSILINQRFVNSSFFDTHKSCLCMEYLNDIKCNLDESLVNALFFMYTCIYLIVLYQKWPESWWSINNLSTQRHYQSFMKLLDVDKGTIFSE